MSQKFVPKVSLQLPGLLRWTGSVQPWRCVYASSRSSSRVHISMTNQRHWLAFYKYSVTSLHCRMKRCLRFLRVKCSAVLHLTDQQWHHTEGCSAQMNCLLYADKMFFIIFLSLQSPVKPCSMINSHMAGVQNRVTPSNFKATRWPVQSSKEQALINMQIAFVPLCRSHTLHCFASASCFQPLIQILACLLMKVINAIVTLNYVSKQRFLSATLTNNRVR